MITLELAAILWFCAMIFLCLAVVELVAIVKRIELASKQKPINLDDPMVQRAIIHKLKRMKAIADGTFEQEK